MDILFIDDDAIETMKLERTISNLGLPHKLTQARNGEEALQELRSGKPLPDLILLDLNMPKMNGIEFLKILRDDEHLQYLPTVILTTSSNRKDLLECYRAGVSGYVLKPLKFEAYESRLKTVLEYWNLNELVKG